MSAVVFVLFLLALLASTDAFSFELPAGATKCFFETLSTDMRFRMQWKADKGYAQFIDWAVRTPSNALTTHDSGLDEAWADFYPVENGDHSICFTNRIAAGARVPSTRSFRSISLELHNVAGDHGDMLDYEAVARREHLEPIQVNIRLAESNLRMVHAEYHHLREHEKELISALNRANFRLRLIPVLLVVIIIGIVAGSSARARSVLRKSRVVD